MTDQAYHRVDREPVELPSGCPIDAKFSPFDDRYLADPYSWLEEKRENEPIFYAEKLGYVVVTRMEDVDAIFKDPAVFSSANVQDPVVPICKEAAAILAADDYNPVAVMSNRQPPDHGRIRRYTQAGFSPRRMQALEPVIRDRASQLIDKMTSDGGPADWVRVVGNPLPAETIFRLIGFPESDDEQLKAWTNNRLEFTWGLTDKIEQIAVAENLLAYWRYVAAFVETRLTEPADDFTSELLKAHTDNPDDLSYIEVQSVVYGLSFAGHEIVRNLISNALLCLLSDRENYRRLCSEPNLTRQAIEEVLRHSSAQTSWRRVTTRDTEFKGIRMPAGTQIFLSLAASNRDPRQFDSPNDFRLDRDNAARHIAFGRGPHICLGRLLAKLELTIVLKLLKEKLPSLRLAAGQGFEYPRNFSFRGPKTLFLDWD